MSMAGSFIATLPYNCRLSDLEDGIINQLLFLLPGCMFWVYPLGISSRCESDFADCKVFEKMFV